jgi:hypothetical protein
MSRAGQIGEYHKFQGLFGLPEAEGTSPGDKQNNRDHHHAALDPLLHLFPPP